jgi:hypothetical protein
VAGEIQVVPAVRGCIYLVPRAEVPLALRFAESIWRKRTDRDLERAGSDWDEVEAVGQAVIEVLRKPSTTDALRKALPPDAVRSFGDQGKKIGLSSPLPVALRDLEFRGLIERTLERGRLDSERYMWRKPKRNPLGKSKAPADPPALAAALAEQFYRQMGASSIEDFVAWAGLSKRDAKAAVGATAAEPVDIEGYDEALVLPEQRADLFAGNPTENVAFIGFEDNLITVHGGVGPLVDAAHHGLEVSAWGRSGTTTLGASKHLANRAIVVGGRVVGFWELDPDAGEVVTKVFAKVPPRIHRSIADESADVARFVERELGHARSFSLDTESALRTRANALRGR